jgi:hypothetical protein
VLWSTRSHVCPQDINSDPAWSGKVYTPVSNKPPPANPLLLLHLLYNIYLYNIYFSATSPLRFFSFLQRCASSSLSCINWSPTSLWVPFYRITLGFNLRAHSWGFVYIFIHPLLILARSTSLHTNSCGFSYYHYHPLDLDPIGLYRSRFRPTRALMSRSAAPADHTRTSVAFEPADPAFTRIGRLAGTRVAERPSIL